MDLGRDYYKLDGPQLESLSAKVRSGDMEEVLRVYEREMQVGHDASTTEDQTLMRLEPAKERVARQLGPDTAYPGTKNEG